MSRNTDDATEEPTFELKKAEYGENGGWEFVADVRVRLHNPAGEDVVALHTYQFGPKHDDLVSDEHAVHQETRWWFSSDRPADGDGPFRQQTPLCWGHFEDPDHDALLDECVEYNALHDPQAVLETLIHQVRDHGRAKRRLTGGSDE
jgi:hypothetical protein